MGSKLTVNHISSSEGQLLLFSGSTADSMPGFTVDPSTFTDTVLWVSGSIGGKNAALTPGGVNQRGVTCFAGDVVISGSLHGGMVTEGEGEEAEGFNSLTINSSLLLTSGSFDFDGDIDWPGEAPMGDDIIFSVSGSVGGRHNSNRPSVAVYGGDLVVSGGIYHYHNPKEMAGSSPLKGYGDIIHWSSPVTSGLTGGGLYYLRAADSIWAGAKADSKSNAKGMNQLLGMALGTNSEAGMLIKGWIRTTVGGAASNKVGLPVYISAASPGAVTTDQPSSSNNFVRIIGYVVDSSGVIYFNPSADWIEL